MRKAFLIMGGGIGPMREQLGTGSGPKPGTAPGITVAGSCGGQAKPDMATIRFLVHTDADTAAAAIEQNQQRLARS